jgi:transcriptional regulator with XRE-family HTH domain
MKFQHGMRAWRLRRGLRQKDLAKLVGTEKSLISRYENGVTGMTFELMLKVMQALNITPNEFYAGPPEGDDTDMMLRARSAFWKTWRARCSEDQAQ